MLTPKGMRRHNLSGSEREAAETLTGVWNGVYWHPFHASVSFTATLIESGNQISGSTHEPCTQFGCPRQTHLATLVGNRQSRAVSFVKSYDPPGFGYDTVTYAGELNADNSEIAGVWSIDSIFSGTFLMIRARPHVVAQTRKKLAIVES
jgi:hypothetical protein